MNSGSEMNHFMGVVKLGKRYNRFFRNVSKWEKKVFWAPSITSPNTASIVFTTTLRQKHKCSEGEVGEEFR